jgi:DHA3 family macrolide efflux protein-like MFS transporter
MSSLQTTSRQAWRKNITWFIIGQQISFIGSLLVQYAIFWYINLETQNGLILTIAILASFIPLLIFSPIAGVLADSMNRKLLIIIADGSIAIVTLITAIIFLLGDGVISVWILIGVTAIRGIGQAIHGPAINASIPLMVPESSLMRIQGIQTGIQSAFNIITPVFAALLISFFNMGALFFVDFITAVLGILTLLLFVHIPKHPSENKPQQSGLHNFKEGVRYVRSHIFLIPFFIYLSMTLFLTAPIAFLSPLQVVRSFLTYETELFRLTIIEITFALGMTAGGALVAWWGGFKNRIVTAGLAITLMGFATTLMGVTPNFYLYAFGMVWLGVCVPFYNATVTVMLQEQVEPEFMGRVMSISTMVNSAAFPIGIMVFGPLADVISIELIMIISGTLMTIIGLLYFFNKVLMQAGVARPTSKTNP